MKAANNQSYSSILLLTKLQTELDDAKSYYQLIINITLSEDLRKDNRLVKRGKLFQWMALENVQILHFMILFKISVFET